jgi:hypothetical protein
MSNDIKKLTLKRASFQKLTQQKIIFCLLQLRSEATGLLA